MPARPADLPTPADGPTPEREALGDLTRRHRLRTPIHGLLVAIDAPEVAGEPWVVDAIDINSRGLGLVLPPELSAGAPVLLSFKLDEDLEFSRVPATVLHRTTLSGAVRFEDWPESERLKLLEYLVGCYESVEDG